MVGLAPQKDEELEMLVDDAEEKSTPPRKRPAPFSEWNRSLTPLEQGPDFHMSRPKSMKRKMLFNDSSPRDMNSNITTPTKIMESLHLGSSPILPPAQHNRSQSTMITSTPSASSHSQHQYVGRRPGARGSERSQIGNNSKPGKKDRRIFYNPLTPNNRERSCRQSNVSRLQRNTKNAASYLDGSFDTASFAGVNTTDFSSSLNLYLESDADVDPELSKPLVLADVAVDRYHTEFVDRAKLGSGNQGNVFKCQNRVDGALYAVKKCKLAACGNEKEAVKEAQAFAAAGPHQNIVRYHNNWYEDRSIFIQIELCNGGSLDAVIAKFRKENKRISEATAKVVLKHCAMGLRHIHSQDLAHLDVKPDNIFICCKVDVQDTLDSFADGAEGFQEDNNTFKLGDFGHVADVHMSTENEGDCRYIDHRVFKGEITDSRHADILALGLSIYEAASGKVLPKNGNEFAAIRTELPVISGYSESLQALLNLMVCSSPEQRPTATDIVNHQIFQEEAPALPVSRANQPTLTVEYAIKFLKEARNKDPAAFEQHLPQLDFLKEDGFSSPNSPTHHEMDSALEEIKTFDYPKYSNADSPGKSTVKGRYYFRHHKKN